MFAIHKDKDLFIGRQEFVVGYSKAPEQPQSSARPICHSHAMTNTGREPATICICIGAHRATHYATGDDTFWAPQRWSIGTIWYIVKRSLRYTLNTVTRQTRLISTKRITEKQHFAWEGRHFRGPIRKRATHDTYSWSEGNWLRYIHIHKENPMRVIWSGFEEI